MKKLIIILIMALSATTFAQTGIGTTNPDASAQLDVSSTTKGFLPPRMTEAQRDAISSPATALIVWCSDCATNGEVQVFNGIKWTNIGGPTKPGAPTIGTATGENTQATVAFTAPANDGGSTITSYTATSNPGNFTGTVTQAGSGTITVTGLTNSTAYTFTVTATNAVGTGAASVASNSVTPFIPVPSVTSTTGRIWMDRNLGASQVATSSTDANSYGDLYQWGRGSDWHQLRTSANTSTLSSADVPEHASFITTSSSPYDWRSPQNSNLWQGVNGVNNPCPSGFRIPTFSELEAERTSWSSNNSAGAFASPLKLPVAGGRYDGSGSLGNVGSFGYYWSSTVDGTYSRYLNFSSSNANMYSYGRAYGRSVRCIKD